MPGSQCSNGLQLPTSTGNEAAVCELDRQSRRWNMFCRIDTFCYRILQTKQELLKCSDWPILNLKGESWEAGVRQELYKSVWQNGMCWAERVRCRTVVTT